MRRLILSPKAQAFAHTKAGFDCKTPFDIAYLLSTIHTPAALYARIKYSGQSQFMPNLISGMEIDILNEIPGIRKWKNPCRVWLKSLCLLAAQEATESTICQTCLGVGQREVGKRVLVCLGCHGAGNLVLREGDRAGRLGVSASAWAHSWRGRYGQIQAATIDNYEGILLQLFTTESP